MTGSRATPTSRPTRAAEWIAYRLLLPVHALLMAVTWIAWAAQQLRLLPRRFGLPRLSARSLATAIDAPHRRESHGVVLHGVCDGRVVARHAPVDGASHARDGRHRRPTGTGRRLLRRVCICTPGARMKPDDWLGG